MARKHGWTCESKSGYASDVNNDKYEMCWLIEEALRVRSWRE